MKLQMILATSLFATTMMTGAALAEDHQVHMLTRGEDGQRDHVGHVALVPVPRASRCAC